MTNKFVLQKELLALITDSGEFILPNESINSHFPNGDAKAQIQLFAYENDLLVNEVESGVQFTIEKQIQIMHEVAENADHHSCGTHSEWGGSEKLCTVCGRKTGELE